MNANSAAKEPFVFHTRLHLSELTGLRARNVGELLDIIRTVPGASIYHHTHRFLQQHEYLSPEPPNDFAYWVSDALGENELGEKLASIDIIQFESIRSLRDRIAETIQDYVNSDPDAANKTAKSCREFHFIKSVSFVASTNFSASNLKEFAEALEKVNINSIYFHVFEARLRLENKSNDFANWISKNLGDVELAEKINRLDPYTYAIDDLRKAIIKIVRERIG